MTEAPTTAALLKVAREIVRLVHTRVTMDGELDAGDEQSCAEEIAKLGGLMSPVECQVPFAARVKATLAALKTTPSVAVTLEDIAEAIDPGCSEWPLSGRATQNRRWTVATTQAKNVLALLSRTSPRALAAAPVMTEADCQRIERARKHHNQIGPTLTYEGANAALVEAEADRCHLLAIIDRLALKAQSPAPAVHKKSAGNCEHNRAVDEAQSPKEDVTL